MTAASARLDAAETKAALAPFASGRVKSQNLKGEQSFWKRPIVRVVGAALTSFVALGAFAADLMDTVQLLGSSGQAAAIAAAVVTQVVAIVTGTKMVRQYLADKRAAAEQQARIGADGKPVEIDCDACARTLKGLQADGAKPKAELEHTAPKHGRPKHDGPGA